MLLQKERKWTWSYFPTQKSKSNIYPVLAFYISFFIFFEDAVESFFIGTIKRRVPVTARTTIFVIFFRRIFTPIGKRVEYDHFRIDYFFFAGVLGSMWATDNLLEKIKWCSAWKKKRKRMQGTNINKKSYTVKSPCKHNQAGFVGRGSIYKYICILVQTIIIYVYLARIRHVKMSRSVVQRCSAAKAAEEVFESLRSRHCFGRITKNLPTVVMYLLWDAVLPFVPNAVTWHIFCL